MIGEKLKNRREELGKDLREISEKLKIKYDYLKAIEEGDIKRLPAEVYVRGYISDYAKYLELDPEKILSEYNRERTPESNRIADTTPEPTKKKSLSTKYIIIALVVLISVLTLLRFNLTNNTKSKPINQGKKTTIETNVEKDKNISDIRTKTIEQKPNLVTTNNITQTPPKKIEENHSLEIIANETTWLLITTDGEESKEYLLKPGETIKCTAKKNFSLKIGNAGGIRLIYNGKDYNNLGQRGQVIRLVLPENPT